MIECVIERQGTLLTSVPSRDTKGTVTNETSDEFFRYP